MRSLKPPIYPCPSALVVVLVLDPCVSRISRISRCPAVVLSRGASRARPSATQSQTIFSKLQIVERSTPFFPNIL